MLDFRWLGQGIILFWRRVACTNNSGSRIGSAVFLEGDKRRKYLVDLVRVDRCHGCCDVWLVHRLPHNLHVVDLDRRCSLAQILLKMIRNPLERPVWSMLTGPQSALAKGGDLAARLGPAVRLDPGYGPFAAAADRSDEAQAALAGLIAPGEQVWLVEPEEWPVPKGLTLLRTAPLLQMVAERPMPVQPEDAEVEPLDEADAAAMTELALATEPGPWGDLTRLYGQFYGIRRDGRLAAMAGERMRPAPGLAEVSAVCTWPDYRGQGLAGKLIRRVMAGFVAQGQVPFLHSYAGNAKAIGLYDFLGFTARREMVVTMLTRN